MCWPGVASNVNCGVCDPGSPGLIGLCVIVPPAATALQCRHQRPGKIIWILTVQLASRGRRLVDTRKAVRFRSVTEHVSLPARAHIPGGGATAKRGAVNRQNKEIIH